MATNNEIKVTVKADNKQFISAMNEVMNAIKKLNGMKFDNKELDLKADKFIKSVDEVVRNIGRISDKAIKITADVSQAMNEINNVQAAIDKLSDSKTIKIDTETSQALNNIEKFQESIDKISDKTIKVQTDTGSASSEIKEIKDLLKDVRNQDINLKITGTPSGMLASFIEKIKDLEIPIFSKSKSDPTGDFSAVTKSGKAFQKVVTAVNNGLKQVTKNIESINKKQIRLKADLKIPKLDMSKLDGDWLKNAVGSAESFIKKLQVIIRLLNQASQTAGKIKIPPLTTGFESYDLSGKNNQPRAPSGNEESGEGLFGSASNLFSGFLGGLAKAQLAAQAVIGVLTGIKDVAASIVMPGFNFVKDMESSKIGMAGTLSSMGQINGEAISFNEAMDIASRMMDKLNMDAIKTAASTKDLVTTFQGLLAPGLGAGFNLEEIREYTKVGVNAAKAMKLGPEQFIQELRDLAQGGITAASSTIATSLGLTDADIKEARNSADGLFKFLMERMAGYKDSAEAYPSTFAGIFDQIGEFATLTSAKISEMFAPEIKEYAKDIAQWFGKVNDKTNEFEINPDILEFIAALEDIYLWTLSVYDAIVNWMDACSKNEAMQEIVAIAKDLWEIVCDLADMLWDAVEIVYEFFRALGNNSVVIKLIELVRILCDAIAELFDIARQGLDIDAKVYKSSNDKVLGKNDAKSQVASEAMARIKAAQFAAAVKRDEQNKKEDRSNQVISKYPKASDEEAKAAKETLKKMLDYWKDKLELIQKEFKKQQESLKLKLDQDVISSDQYHLQELENSISEKEANLSLINEKIEAIQNLALKDDEKDRKLSDLNRDKVILQADIDDLKNVFAEMVSVLGQYNTVTPEQAIKKYGLDPSGFESDDFSSSAVSELDRIVGKYAKMFEVDPYLIKAMINQESGGNVNSLSDAGAQGIMQLMPDTAASMGVTDPYDMEQNIMGGIKYISEQLKTFGDVGLALAAYNAGPQAVKDAGNKIPSYSETQNYVPAVLAKMDELKEAAQNSSEQSQNGEGKTWYRVTSEDPKYEALEPQAKVALDMVAGYFKRLTGKQLGVTSGKRSADLGYSEEDIGGHGTGLKFDAAAAALNDPEIRQKVIDFARSVGIEVLDEYANPTRKATAKHLDFNAQNFDSSTAKIAGLNMDITGEVKAKQTYDTLKDRLEVRDKAREVLKKYNELMLGDISEYQMAEIEAQYEAVRKKLKNHENDKLARDALSKIDKIMQAEKLNIDFSQTQKDLEYANEELTEYQEELVKSVSNISIDAKEVLQNYIDKVHEKTDKYREELQRQLEIAKGNGVREDALKIGKAIKAIDETILTGLNDLISAYDKQLQIELAEINANRKMTKMQKQDAIDDAQRRQHAKEATMWRATAEYHMSSGEYAKAADAKRQADLADKLAEIPSLLDKIHEASTQAFEDGLLDFLERGIFECENLGEAFKELAITVLQSMQKVFAEDWTKNIMTGLGFGDRYKKKEDETDQTSQATQVANLSGTFGNITNQTNGFLSSFDGQMMQFAQQAQIAFQNILQTISSAASAIPASMPMMGGNNIPSTSGGIGDFYQPQHGLDYSSIPKYAEGGSTTQGDNGGFVSGPGTGTSDSILSWVGNRLVRIANGEYVVNADAVKRVGTNFLDRVNSGDIYNMHIPIPKFAHGGTVGKVAANAAMQGLTSFSQELGTNISPTFNNIADVRIDGGEVANAFRGMIKADVKSHVEKEMVQNAKRNFRIMEKMR